MPRLTLINMIAQSDYVAAERDRLKISIALALHRCRILVSSSFAGICNDFHSQVEMHAVASIKIYLRSQFYFRGCLQINALRDAPSSADLLALNLFCF